MVYAFAYLVKELSGEEEGSVENSEIFMHFVSSGQELDEE